MKLIQKAILLAMSTLLPVMADEATMLPNQGSRTSYSADSSEYLYSVVGAPFVGMMKDDVQRIYSGYLKMPQVYSFMYNEAPEFVSDVAATVPEGSKWAYTALALDPENEELTYKFTSIPSGFYVSADDNRVLKTESMSDKNGTITVIATDPGGLSDTLHVALTAKKELSPLQITSSSVADTATEDELYASAVLTNYDGFDEDSLAFEIRLDVAPRWLKLQKNASGQYILAGTPLNGNGDTTVVLSAFFSNNPDSVAALLNKKITVIPVNDAPVLADQSAFTAIAAIPFTTTLKATDVDDTVLTYTLVEGPTGLTVDGAGTVAWTPDTAFVGEGNLFTVTVTDPAGANDTKEYSITVAPPGVPVCQSVGPVDSIVAGAVTVPYTLADATDDAISFTLELLLGDSVIAIEESALTGAVSAITADDYTGSIIWNSVTSLAGVAVDSVRLRLTPSDATGIGVSAMTNYFRVNNTASMKLSSVSPAANAAVSGYNGQTITVTLSGYNMDTTSIETPLTVTGSVSKTFTYTVVSKSKTGFTVLLDKQPASGETVTVTLTETPLDISGKAIVLTAGQESWNYKVALLGDFNRNDTIADLTDLATLSTLWYQSANSMKAAATVNSTELAPAFGTAPYLRVVPDSTFDYEDLISFLRIWKWSYHNDNTSVAAPAASRSGSVMSNSLSVRSGTRAMPSEDDSENSVHTVSVNNNGSDYQLVISVEDVEDAVAGEYSIWYDQATTSFEGVFSEEISLLELDGGQLFEIMEEGEGYLRIARTRLAKQSRSVSGSGAVVTLDFTTSDETTPITVQYKMIDTEYDILDFGVTRVSPRAVITPEIVQDIDTMTVFPNPAPVAEGFRATTLSSDLSSLVEQAKSNGGVVITLDKRGFAQSAEPVIASIQIRDALGNLIVEERDMAIDFDYSDHYGFYWSGHNSVGREVTNGIYLAILKWEQGDKTGMAKTVIGIKKENAR